MIGLARNFMIRYKPDLSELARIRPQLQRMLLGGGGGAALNQVTQGLGNQNAVITQGLPVMRKSQGATERLSFAQRMLRTSVLNSTKAAMNSVAIWGMAAGVFYGAARGLMALARNIAAVENGLINLKKVAGAGADIGLLQEYSERMATVYGVDQVAVLDNMTRWLRVTDDVGMAIKGTYASLLLATATTVDHMSATKMLIAVMKNYELGGNDLLKLVDALNTMENRSGAEMSELSEAMLLSAASARTLNLSLDEMLGFLTQISVVTQFAGGMVGRSFRFFARVFRRPEVRANVEELLGTQIDLANGLRGVLDQVSGLWVDMTGIQRIQLAAEMAGTRHTEEFIVLMNYYTEALETVGQARRADATALEEAALEMSSFTGQWKRTIETVKVAIAHHGQPILVFLSSMMRQLRTLGEEGGAGFGILVQGALYAMIAVQQLAAAIDITGRIMETRGLLPEGTMTPWSWETGELQKFIETQRQMLIWQQKVEQAQLHRDMMLLQESEKAQQRLKAAGDAMEYLDQQTAKAADTIREEFADALYEVVQGTKDWEDALKSVADWFGKETFRNALVQALGGGARQPAGGFLGNLFGALGQAYKPTTGAATSEDVENAFTTIGDELGLGGMGMGAGGMLGGPGPPALLALAAMRAAPIADMEMGFNAAALLPQNKTAMDIMWRSEIRRQESEARIRTEMQQQREEPLREQWGPRAAQLIGPLSLGPLPLPAKPELSEWVKARDAENKVADEIVQSYLQDIYDRARARQFEVDKFFTSRFTKWLLPDQPPHIQEQAYRRAMEMEYGAQEPYAYKSIWERMLDTGATRLVGGEPLGPTIGPVPVAMGQGGIATTQAQEAIRQSQTAALSKFGFGGQGQLAELKRTWLGYMLQARLAQAEGPLEKASIYGDVLAPGVTGGLVAAMTPFGLGPMGGMVGGQMGGIVKALPELADMFDKMKEAQKPGVPFSMGNFLGGTVIPGALQGLSAGGNMYGAAGGVLGSMAGGWLAAALPAFAAAGPLGWVAALLPFVFGAGMGLLGPKGGGSSRTPRPDLQAAAAMPYSWQVPPVPELYPLPESAYFSGRGTGYQTPGFGQVSASVRIHNLTMLGGDEQAAEKVGRIVGRAVVNEMAMELERGAPVGPWGMI